MTEEDILEEISGTTHYLPAESLDEITLPEDYPEDPDVGKPKTLVQAEGRLFERIMDPTAPDDSSSKGVYMRIRVKGGE